MKHTLFRIGGIVCFLDIVLVIIFFAWAGAYEGSPADPASKTLETLSKAPASIVTAAWLGTFIDILEVFIAVVLYFALYEQRPAYAMLGLIIGAVGHLIVILNDSRMATISWDLAQNFAAGGAAKDTALIVMSAIDKWINQTAFFAGGILVGGSYFIFGVSMFGSQNFPRWLGWLMGIGGLMLFVGAVFSVFSPGMMMLFMAALLVIAVSILISGIYLLRIKV